MSEKAVGDLKSKEPLQPESVQERFSKFYEKIALFRGHLVSLREDQGLTGPEADLDFSGLTEEELTSLAQGLGKEGLIFNEAWMNLKESSLKGSSALPGASGVIHDMLQPYMSLFSGIEFAGSFSRKPDEEVRSLLEQRARFFHPVFLDHFESVLRSLEGEIGEERGSEEFDLAEPAKRAALLAEKLNIIGVYEVLPPDCISISQQIPRGLMVKGNKQDWYRVLYNLLRNSQKALQNRFEEEGKRGKISISAKADKEGRGVEIVVADNGPGIDAEAAYQDALAKDLTEEMGQRAPADEKIQLVFIRGVSGFGSRSKTRGLGLGLAISKELVEGSLGGKIRVESKQGKGTKFIIELPRVVQDTRISC